MSQEIWTPLTDWINTSKSSSESKIAENLNCKIKRPVPYILRYQKGEEETHFKEAQRELPMDTDHQIEPHSGEARVEAPDSTGYDREGSKVAPEDESWCPPAQDAGKDVMAHPLDNVSFIADGDWKWGDIEYGRWTSQFDRQRDHQT